MNKFIVKPNKSVKEIIEVNKEHKVETGTFYFDNHGRKMWVNSKNPIVKIDVRNPQELYNRGLI
jgi:hypothetical protein